MASDSSDKKLLQIWGGEKLLTTIIFVGTLVLFFILWTNRHISRMFLISKKGPHISIGNDAPRGLKRIIDKYFMLIVRLAIEPKLLSDQGCKDSVMTSFVERRDESTYTYRRKAFDLMSCLDDLLCRVDVCLASKPEQTIREHMEELQRPPYAPFVDCKELCDRVIARYEHARYGTRSFDFGDFERFSEDIQALTQKIHDKLQVPGSLVVPISRSAKNESQSSVQSKEKSQGLIEIDAQKDAVAVGWSKDDTKSCTSSSNNAKIA
eukprot:Seg599.9 transcript_id=Seg599.9/GoldUCD/mRNA.D3Y31 product="putative protein C1orf43-like" protein_id=Seg599.9/GoldUCD/D3Y31